MRVPVHPCIRAAHSSGMHGLGRHEPTHEVDDGVAASDDDRLVLLACSALVAGRALLEDRLGGHWGRWRRRRFRRFRRLRRRGVIRGGPLSM